MREAVGNTFIFNVVIIFIVVATLVLVGSLGYSKGFKAKNKIIRIIEDNQGYNHDTMEQIDSALLDNGYRLKSAFARKSCPDLEGSTLLEESKNYLYCVYSNNTERGIYYSVIIYIRFEIPILSGILEFPVKGDTRTIYDLNEGIPT